MIEAEVHCNLSQYDIDEGIPEEITDEVKVRLEERRARSYEQGPVLFICPARSP